MEKKEKNTKKSDTSQKGKNTSKKNETKPTVKKTKDKKVKESNKFKAFFQNKRNKYIIIGIAVIILIILIILLIKFIKKEKYRFSLNEIYNIYPEEVRKLYANVVETSCHGDLHLDIKMEDKEVKIADLNRNNSLDYLFSNIDKNEGLSDKMETSFIRSRQRELFYTDIDMVELIDNYQYGDYIYNVEGSKITRKKHTCESDMEYVAFLYGYSYKKEMLTMNVNIAYKKDDKLYDLANRELGKYSGDASELFELTKSSSYYRFNYVKEGDMYKLDNVRWMNRS